MTTLTFSDVTEDHEARAEALLGRLNLEPDDMDDDVQGALDDMVHDSASGAAAKAWNAGAEGSNGDLHNMASGLASDTNNLGALGQVAWLLAQGHTEDGLETFLSNA